MNEIVNNKVNLCDSCSQVYPDCTSRPENVYFGDGIGNDNICACSKYRPSAHPEIIRCKDCKHRPIATRADEGILWGFSVEFPDEICPLQCEDGWYSHYPKDDFYCANAERRTDGVDS